MTGKPLELSRGLSCDPLNARLVSNSESEGAQGHLRRSLLRKAGARREVAGKAEPAPSFLCPYGACIDHLVARESGAGRT